MAHTLLFILPKKLKMIILSYINTLHAFDSLYKLDKSLSNILDNDNYWISRTKENFPELNIDITIYSGNLIYYKVFYYIDISYKYKKLNYISTNILINLLNHFTSLSVI